MNYFFAMIRGRMTKTIRIIAFIVGGIAVPTIAGVDYTPATISSSQCE